ncbi:MAG TPA: HAMP domain-containing sensor histidine kinase [Burkholderiaceae bacterium]
MYRLRASIAARLVLGYGLLVAASFVAVSAVFYFGTIGVLNRGIDTKVVSISNRLSDVYQSQSIEGLSREINRELADGIDSDTELFLVLSSTGSPIAGNLSTAPDVNAPREQLITREVVRDGKAHRGRLLLHSLPDGGLLVVGRDLSEQESIQFLVWRALASGAGISLLLAVVGALVFRQQIEARIGEIRRTAAEIEAGDLTRRIPVLSNDEFGLLNQDINRMLDRIEQLMDGIRHVSNAIAHDLRTPLSRIRSKLDDAIRHDMTVEILSDAAHEAIAGVDDLILVFEKLLQIAEAESGMREQSFEPVDLSRIASDMVELYDATAEEQQLVLKASLGNEAPAHGDRNLLASAVANLIDNAIKYAGPGATIEISTSSNADTASITVRDNGSGIPMEQLPKVTERFYRLDSSRSLPGNGLGLSIVSAIATLHRGKFILENDNGLIARITLPRATEIAKDKSRSHS